MESKYIVCFYCKSLKSRLNCMECNELGGHLKFEGVDMNSVVLTDDEKAIMKDIIERSGYQFMYGEEEVDFIEKLYLKLGGDIKIVTSGCDSNVQ